MREATFTFVPEELIKEQSDSVGCIYRVTLTKNKSIYFPTEVLDVYELDGKMLKFFADKAKKTIGWSVITESNLENLQGVKLRQVKRNQSNNNATMMIGKLLDYIGIKTDVVRSSIPVKVYKDLVYKRDIYYIELNEVKHDKSKEIKEEVGSGIFTN